jgi:hypothetical protein
MDASNHAGVAFEIDDLGALKEMLAAMPPDMAAQAESHGAAMSTMTMYVEAEAALRPLPRSVVDD